MQHNILDFSKYISASVNCFFLPNTGKKSCVSIANDIGYLKPNLAIPEQIHSTNVQCIDGPGKFLAVDGLITQVPAIILTLKVADCVPLFLYVPHPKIIGLIHIGWRGTLSGIIANTIKLLENIGAKSQDIIAYLGPAIGMCCYEVGEEIAIKFDCKNKIRISENKWKVSLHGQISRQLLDKGLARRNIMLSSTCTFETANFHSFRRDGSDADRMYAFMKIKR